MAKWISQMMVSADGFFEGPDREIGWHQVDGEYNAYTSGLLESVEAILFGRVTYELMADYWPTAAAVDNDRVAGHMNRLRKYVATHTLQHASWHNTTVLSGDIADSYVGLQPPGGGDVAILGSGTLAASMSQADLIDEYQLIVNPVVLGSGRPFLSRLNPRMRLELAEVKAFRSGNVLLVYRSLTARR
ncbi:dihydrofolate reductase family protein [Paenibacillus sp. 1P07SE]|uniref:dihydrofolate reductase family protein n=1 Tax=Paenibacillus sp. 1P07SE TaxID=3132209 RepID=UPI0039A77B69